MKILRLYWEFAKRNAYSRMQYRFSFTVFVLAIIFMYFTNLCLIWVMLEKFGEINGWKFEEVAFMYSLGLLSYGLYALFFSHFRYFDRLILKGDFDFLLLRPVNVLLQAVMKDFDLRTVAHMSFGLTIFIISSRMNNIDWGLGYILLITTTIVGSVLIQVALCICVATLSFWLLRSKNLYELVVQTPRNFIWFPLSIFSSSMQFVLTFAIPYAFVSYYPSRIFLNKTEPNIVAIELGYYTLCVGSVLFIVSYVFWEYGLKHYTSTGS